ncbi:MAG: VOC family protein [Pyrinomonadaceae bacterium]
MDQKGEGVHHIAFRVKGMKDHVAALEKKGGQLIQHGDFTGGSYAYVDLTTQLGVIVELLTNAQEEEKEKK